MSDIKQFYKMCAIESNTNPMINHLGDNINKFLSDRQVSLFLIKKQDGYKIKETVIGGGKGGVSGKILIV
jgi:hypothetical protein